ncbi:MAG: hypothetical protein EB084_00860 [Proteobacteria bacterium]|nr:hypothetical protein [Pseudomonadota bacterium]
MGASAIELRRPVDVKVIMSPGFREQLTAEARDTLARIDRNLSIIEGLPEPRDAQQETERARLLSLKAQLEWRMREVEGVEDGAELPFRSFEGTVTLAEGDDFLQKMGHAEVVLLDWKVVEIRGL